MDKVESLSRETLDGRFIALEPLGAENRDALAAAGGDDALFTYMPFDPKDGFAARLAWAEDQNRTGAMLTFVVRRKADGAVVGSSSYLNIAPADAKVEIGWTWYVAQAQASAVNPEAKYLLLRNAFTKGFNRVEFKTDSKNARSRAALTKLGAKEEGTLRGHMWMPQGYFRDSVYFSILASEWPAVKAQLEARLAAFG